MNELLQEIGITLTPAHEALIVYVVAICIIALTLYVLFANTKDVKGVLKAVAVVIFDEHKISDEKIEEVYDRFMLAIKATLKRPNDKGKIPIVNKILIVLLSIPYTKKIIVHKVKEFVKELREDAEKEAKALKKDEQIKIDDKVEEESTEETSK